MPIDPASLKSLRSLGEVCAWDDRDALLYALAVGIGRGGGNPKELPYVYEAAGLRTVPTMATTLVTNRFLHDCGWDAGRVLHVAERISIRRPLPESGRFVIDSHVAEVTDKGADRGLLIRVDSFARTVSGDAPVFTVSRTLLARGDGGAGKSAAGPESAVPEDAGPAIEVRPLPSVPPDLACASSTRADQALLFRLCGDRNPLHADPVFARRAGFDTPILHGLCTFGIACRAILETICEYDHTLITSFEGRFKAPARPGDTLNTEMWQEANIISFRVTAVERDIVVLDHGRCILAA